ncbi:hypothetical protein Z043_100211 [Scleropages formosus]|uniref:Uncharacterized protein n=1 Tax=Scleropages formosus TaxID=113540 RepID=A0A0P7W148_SCLFO|nr:hypothetical protein Z043_100211 [Scleropages formosus]
MQKPRGSGPAAVRHPGPAWPHVHANDTLRSFYAGDKETIWMGEIPEAAGEAGVQGYDALATAL